MNIWERNASQKEIDCKVIGDMVTLGNSGLDESGLQHLELGEMIERKRYIIGVGIEIDSMKSDQIGHSWRVKQAMKRWRLINWLRKRERERERERRKVRHERCLESTKLGRRDTGPDADGIEWNKKTTGMGPLFIRQTTSSWLLRKPRVNFGGRKTILYIYFDIIKLIKNDCLKDSWRRGAKLQQEMEYQIKKSALFILCFCSDSFLYSKQNVRWLDWSLKRRRVSIEVDRCWCVCFGSRCDGLRFLHGGLTFHFSPFFFICIYIYLSLSGSLLEGLGKPVVSFLAHVVMPRWVRNVWGDVRSTCVARLM